MHKPVIVPFWERLREFAEYPFRDSAKYTLIVLSVLIVLVGWLPIIGTLCWLAAFKFAFEILVATANGKLKAPEVVFGIDNSVVGKYVLLQILTIIVPMAVGFVAGFGVAMTVFVLFVVVQPAAIMGLALTQSLRRALTPSLWFEVMRRVGWPYLALFGLLLVMQLSAANATDLLAQVLPYFLASAANSVFTLWSLFATFHLMGYMVYQYHEVLEFEPSAFAEQAELPFNRDRELLERASGMVQEGQVDEARALLAESMRERAVTAEVHDLYRRLLIQQGDEAKVMEHARSFLHLLMIEKQDKRAMLLLRECLAKNPDFAMLDIEHQAKLAEQAATSGQSKLAGDLLCSAVRAEPGHEYAGRWALRAVELITRVSGREAEAREVLQRARKHCRDAELGGRIDSQLSALPAG